MTFRTESDSLGEIQIPEYALWGAQTQRAIVHFPNLGYSMPHGVIQALALIKKAAALANLELGELQSEQSSLIIAACDEVLSHRHDEQFPLSIWQSGSGTQSNMNMNEVVANRANELAGHMRGEKTPVHPNDHVNRSQSSNDVFPTAMHIIVAVQTRQKILPAIEIFESELMRKQEEFHSHYTVARTHLMDALPIQAGAILSAYSSQMAGIKDAIIVSLHAVYQLALGGTAIGSGANSPALFGQQAIKLLADYYQLPFSQNANLYAGVSSEDILLRYSATLKQLAAASVSYTHLTLPTIYSV